MKQFCFVVRWHSFWRFPCSMRKAQLRRNSQARLKGAQTRSCGAGSHTPAQELFSIPMFHPSCGPFAEVGRQTFDGKGNTDATATLSTNGNIVQVTIAGTYTVNRTVQDDDARTYLPWVRRSTLTL